MARILGREGASLRVSGMFQGGGAGGNPIRVGGVVYGPPHGQGPGEFSAQICQVDYGETSEATSGWDLVVPTAGDSDGGDGV